MPVAARSEDAADRIVDGAVEVETATQGGDMEGPSVAADHDEDRKQVATHICRHRSPNFVGFPVLDGPAHGLDAIQTRRYHQQATRNLRNLHLIIGDELWP